MKVTGKTTADTAAFSADPESAEALIHELVARQWTMVCIGRKTAPAAIAAYHQTNHQADVIILRGPDRAAAYRAHLQGPDDNPLTANHVVWHYLANAAQTLHAILHLNPENTTTCPYPIPADCRLPELTIRPLTIRPGARRQGGGDRAQPTN
jgi:hypothetical protein